MNKEASSISRQVIVKNDLDIVKARLRAREMARAMGFNTVDQARISLAVGELARVLTRNLNQPATIDITGVNNGGQIGIEVVSIDPVIADVATAPGVEPQDLGTQRINDDDNQKVLTSAFALVDEYAVEAQDQDGTRITLMKWLS